MQASWSTLEPTRACRRIVANMNFTTCLTSMYVATTRWWRSSTLQTSIKMTLQTSAWRRHFRLGLPIGCNTEIAARIQEPGTAPVDLHRPLARHLTPTTSARGTTTESASRVVLSNQVQGFLAQSGKTFAGQTSSLIQSSAQTHGKETALQLHSGFNLVKDLWLVWLAGT